MKKKLSPNGQISGKIVKFQAEMAKFKAQMVIFQV